MKKIIKNIDWEAVITYVIAAICILLSVDGHINDSLTGTDIRWLLGFAVFLTTERDLKKFMGV